jgi:hypothetical protein
MSTVIAPKLVFLSHRWPLGLDAGGRVTTQASAAVGWPGGVAKLAIASNDPSRRFPGTTITLQAHGPEGWRPIVAMAEPGGYEAYVPAGPVRLLAEGGERGLLITCTANWYPPAVGADALDLGLVA